MLALLSSTTPAKLLIVGSYRDDELPSLPQRLSAMQLLKLNRFSADHVEALSAAILGAPGRNPELVAFLQRETEGNAFFLVEVMRALAENTANLDEISGAALPDHITAMGVQNVVNRRLAHIPAAMRSLLDLAAVVGRDLDLAVLEATSLTDDLAAWLNVCAEYAVLDVQAERWRFAHDKLREGVLAGLDDAQRRVLHEQAAQAIERVYADEPGYAATLAYHWGKAANVDKERHYAALGGERALAEGAIHEAVRLLSRALALGSADPLQQAHLEQLLAEALYNLGSLDDSHDHALQALHLLGFSIPLRAAALSIGTLYQLARQAAHRLIPQLALRRATGNQATRLRIAALAYERVSVIDYFNNTSSPAVFSAMTALNLNEHLPASPALARCYTNTGMGFSVIRQPGLAERYLELGSQTAQFDLAAQYWAATVSAVYWLGQGNFGKATGFFNKGIALTRQLGNPRGLSDIYFAFSVLNFCSGDFGACRQTAWESYSAAVQSHSSRALQTAANFEFAVLLVQDKLAESRIGIDVLEDIARQTNLGEQISCYGILCAVYDQMGRREAAHTAAQRGFELSIQTPATLYSGVIGYSHLAHAFLGWWEDGDLSQAPYARQMATVLNSYTTICPLGKPTTQRIQGLCSWLEGKRDVAVAAWQRGLKEAQSLQTRYEMGLLHYELGRHFDVGHPQRREHLNQAAAIFEEVGALRHLKRLPPS